MGLKENLKIVWKFLWNDNSIWSWVVNAGLAFIIIKFLLYPGLGLVLDTDNPVVAVVSDSMKYKDDFGVWWQSMGGFYEKLGIQQEDFKAYTLSNGFNKGDIIIIKGKKPQNIKMGDIIVFKADRPEPIIHRVVRTWEASGKHYYSTKGDRNNVQLDTEKEISEDRVIGTAWVRVPYVGYVKIGFTNLISLIARRG